MPALSRERARRSGTRFEQIRTLSTFCCCAASECVHTPTGSSTRLVERRVRERFPKPRGSDFPHAEQEDGGIVPTFRRPSNRSRLPLPWDSTRHVQRSSSGLPRQHLRPTERALRPSSLRRTVVNIRNRVTRYKAEFRPEQGHIPHRSYRARRSRANSYFEHGESNLNK